MASLAALRPNHHHQPAIEMARGEKPDLAVIEPFIDDRRGAAGKHFAGPREVQTAMPEREIAFGRIEVDLQINVPPINVKPERWLIQHSYGFAHARLVGRKPGQPLLVDTSVNEQILPTVRRRGIAAGGEFRKQPRRLFHRLAAFALVAFAQSPELSERRALLGRADQEISVPGDINNRAPVIETVPEKLRPAAIAEVVFDGIERPNHPDFQGG